jgi:phospholipid/cholesterol/gamma-HCH transport system substrate-binding protein
VRRLALLLACVVLATGVACSSSDDIQATATFTDVGDLATLAPVTMADIQVGQVDDIRLVGREAVVTMSLYKSAKIPANVIARIRRTSVLGERIVDLVVPEGAPTSNVPLLQDGDEISETVVRSDLEDLVREGSDVLAAISASDLAVMIHEGARGFGGQGAELRNLLDNYEEILTAYASRGRQIKSLITSLDNFNRTIASRAGAHARSLVNANRSFEVLNEESERLGRAIVALNRLSIAGKDILNRHSDEMKRFFAHMRVILRVLEDEQDSIRLLLRYAPGHNRNTQLVEYSDFNQVIQDFVICGMNDNPKDPARRCKGSH